MKVTETLSGRAVRGATNGIVNNAIGAMIADPPGPTSEINETRWPSPLVNTRTSAFLTTAPRGGFQVRSPCLHGWKG